jgi:hypothetical protein
MAALNCSLVSFSPPCFCSLFQPSIARADSGAPCAPGRTCFEEDENGKRETREVGKRR